VTSADDIELKWEKPDEEGLVSIPFLSTLRQSWSQSYDIEIYSYNASVVVG
jgi:hypothetical protein